jgi:RNA polymerase sigma-70 factor (ECF subfamily)
MSAPGVTALVEHLFRRQAGASIAVLTRIFGAARLDLVEEVVQDALVRALEVWPHAGVPANPRAWLIQTAKNRAINLLKREDVWSRKVQELLDAWPATVTRDAERLVDPELVADDQVAMLFMCCHPLVPRDASVALALKVVAGFGVREIARAFLAEETAVAQRLVRAKRRIRDDGISLDLPEEAEIESRLASVLEVLYLWFNEGYIATEGAELLRRDLCDEALRLTRALAFFSRTDRPATHALLALMALQAARFPARMDDEQRLLLLRDQDRQRWDPRLLAVGFTHLAKSAHGDVPSTYHLEAGIAACHAAARSYEETDWTRIVDLYDLLYPAQPTPVIALNRAIARSRLSGPRQAIAEITALRSEPTLAKYRWVPAVLGALWAEAGDPREAANEYRRALAFACTEPERRLLEDRLAGG